MSSKGYDSDSDEEYDTNVSKSVTDATQSDGTRTYSGKNGCGRRAQLLVDKKEVNVRIQLFTALSSISGLIPNGMSLGLKVFLTSSNYINNYLLYWYITTF